MGPFLIVRVARSCVTGVFFWTRVGVGIALSVESCTVASPRRNAGDASFGATEGLNSRPSILTQDLLKDFQVFLLLFSLVIEL